MTFVAYFVGLIATFIGVAALYGTLLKPFTTKLHEPVHAAVEERAAPETTQAIRAGPARKPPRGDEASEARAEVHERRAARRARRSPVRSEPEGLRLRPERCWVVTDSTRNYGYYGECR